MYKLSKCCVNLFPLRLRHFSILLILVLVLYNDLCISRLFQWGGSQLKRPSRTRKKMLSPVNWSSFACSLQLARNQSKKLTASSGERQRAEADTRLNSSSFTKVGFSFSQGSSWQSSGDALLSLQPNTTTGTSVMHFDAFISQQINGATATMTPANSYHLKRPLTVSLSSLLSAI